MVSMHRDSLISDRAGGFTFIELLATVVLIAVIMPVAMRSIGLCTRLGGLSRRQIEAASLAKAKMTELTVTGDWASGNQHGSFGGEWPGYEWRVSVTNWTDTTVREFDLTVLWESAGRQREVTLSTLVYPESE
ncbi:MAG: prepilin-type N-terminal cleavage/methylation domain-containing protein [Sedimentisphaerales bacterium]|nr:prepilin-type N-terminal cleavage/methylation domain-containing protein [Sedimentisphaerales bacterium]